MTASNGPLLVWKPRKCLILSFFCIPFPFILKKDFIFFRYVVIMISISSAQRSLVPIDPCVVGLQYPAFLQQVPHYWVNYQFLPMLLYISVLGPFLCNYSPYFTGNGLETLFHLRCWRAQIWTEPISWFLGIE